MNPLINYSGLQHRCFNNHVLNFYRQQLITTFKDKITDASLRRFTDCIRAKRITDQNTMEELNTDIINKRIKGRQRNYKVHMKDLRKKEMETSDAVQEKRTNTSRRFDEEISGHLETEQARHGVKMKNKYFNVSKINEQKRNILISITEVQLQFST